MKVLYLFNKVRKSLEADVKKGVESDAPFFGMYRLVDFNIQAEYVEIEQIFPQKVCIFLRKYVLNVYYVHLPLFYMFFRYNIIFTPTAFGSLLVKAIFGFRKPKWVMFDFSISGIVGNQTTLKQVVFKFLVARGADGIITISQEEAQRVKILFPHLAKNIAFIRYATNTDFFKPRADILETGGVITVGRDPYRDLSTFVEALADVKIPVTLIARSEQVEKLGVLPKNFIHKNPTALDLVTEYAQAKVFVLPLRMKDKLNEAVGCSTLVEAMAMGKAIVATRTFTMESYITDGVNGILIPEGDVQAMKSAVNDLLHNDDKRARLGMEARKFAEEYCRTEQFTESLAHYLKKITTS